MPTNNTLKALSPDEAGPEGPPSRALGPAAPRRKVFGVVSPLSYVCDGGRQLVVLELLAQACLQDLAGRGVRQRPTNSTSSGIHHLATLPSKNSSSSVLVDLRVGLLHHDQQRPLVPFRMATPITAASATAGCATATFSRSIELIHSPPDLITSLERSVICM